MRVRIRSDIHGCVTRLIARHRDLTHQHRQLQHAAAIVLKLAQQASRPYRWCRSVKLSGRCPGPSNCGEGDRQGIRDDLRALPTMRRRFRATHPLSGFAKFRWSPTPVTQSNGSRLTRSTSCWTDSRRAFEAIFVFASCSRTDRMVSCPRLVIGIQCADCASGFFIVRLRVQREWSLMTPLRVCWEHAPGALLNVLEPN
jgi:hypothetical protein